MPLMFPENEYDECGTYSDEDTLIWYDTEGCQHVTFLSDYLLEDFEDVYDISVLQR